MGRKILCLKKIENLTRCQVTFCKRRSRLIKKANEISVCCDAEVALLAFSPSGRISKFSSPKSIEELIYRYVNLPPDMRFNDMDDVQDKLEKLQQLNHIKGDQRKLYCLDQQLENLELQVKKSTLQIQILETGLRVYEPQEQEPTLDQLVWLENNLRNSLEKVIQRKKVISGGIPLAQKQQIIPMRMAYKGVTPLVNNFSGRDSNARGSNSSRGKLPMQLVPHSVEVPEVLMQNRINRGNRKTMCDQGLAISTSHSTRNIAEKVKSQIPFRFQLSRPVITRETQFVPPVEIAYEGVTPLMNNFSGHNSNAGGSNSSRGKLPMQLVPHSAEVPEGLIQNRINQGNRKTICNQGLAKSTSYSTRNIAEKVKSQIPFRFQTPRPVITRETHFVPLVENTFRSAAQSYPEIPNRSMFDNGSFIQTLNDTPPSYFERTAHLPPGESIFNAFSLNNGQTGIDKTQTFKHKILPAPGHLNMGVNKHNGNGVMNTTSFYNNNIHNSSITGSGFGIAESNPPQDLLRDDTPGTSYSRARESGFVDPKYDGLTYKDLKDFLN